MKEIRPTSYQHIEALHYLANIPFRGDIGLRANKEIILEKYGFNKGANVAIRKEFELPEANEESFGIRDYIAIQIGNNRFLSMLLNDGHWESMGGCPVVYILSQEDLDKKLCFEEGRLTAARSHDGTLVSIDHPYKLHTFSRRRSFSSELSGFVNYDGVISVQLGGGFRLQLDNLAFIGGQPYLEFSGYFSFNDIGPRVLELSCEEDRKVPRFNTSFLVQIDGSRLQYCPEKSGINPDTASISEVGEVVNRVIGRLFETDGRAISDLYRDLLTVRPSMKIHQLVGIFSFPGENNINVEVTDFDGLETFDIDEHKTIMLSPTERLTRGQLYKTGFLHNDTEALMSFISLRSRIKEGIEIVMEQPFITEDIKREVRKHFLDSPELFSRNLTGAVRLSRLLKSLGIEGEDTMIPQVKCFRNGNDEITLISIEGFDIAFWKNNGELIDCSNIRALSKKLSQITGKELVEAHFSSIREGD